MKEKRKYLYALECEDSCYYIGQTNDIVRRFRQHKEQGDEGSVWTSNHKPIRIVETWNLETYSQESAMNFENKLTIEYINKYGWDKVRGGIYIFFDGSHHFGLLNLYNNIVNGVFVPKATEEKIEAFMRIKQKALNFNIKKDIAYIYVLKLVENKVFVGRSSNLLKDLRRHLYSSMSKWTDLYSPIDLLEIQVDTDLGKNNPCTHRNKIVFKYMEIYGWANVRGGDYKIINSESINKLLIKKGPELLFDNTKPKTL